ncbi:MAG TPA: ABC transporter ATP-binding protein [Candidatus Fimimorpha excrementavium]|nr:ABC transporter ATP-binding protein [Candidatus Fimimorpha excrementavium]
MLEVSGLKKNYGDFKLNCSMRVEDGRITGLIGENGAGKSTAFKAILGLIAPDEGTIRIFGKEREKLSVDDRQNIGVVLSDSGFSGYLTIKDIIPVLKHLYDRFDPVFFRKQVRRFQLPTDKTLKEFSTGMKAKLKVLAATSVQAKLLLLDEPTAGLDVIARDELLEMLREYMERYETTSVLISSHISSDLETLCDDVYMIHGGRIIMHEDVDVLLSDYALLKVSEEQYAGLDKQYILRVKKEPYGYCCLTDQRQYYLENYPSLAIEKGSIDGTITMMIRGENV